VVDIPPLRERTGDALLLAHGFLRRFAQEQRRQHLAFGEDALRAIEHHNWPGNVRELLNATKRASIMCEGDRVSCEDLGLPAAPEHADEGERSDLDLRSVREAAERQAIMAALGRTNGNIVKASEVLGVSRPTLYDLMRRLAIK
jgi:two-component system NtrC family response regulator